jgi:glycosyltransferase involved in cell wall biosynthesis
VLVSVLINNYNYAVFLEEAVASVLSQTYPDIEIIIVDDGSTDESRHLIEKLASAHPTITPHFKPNGGQLSAFNAGVELARGELLFFLDADDLYHQDYIEKAVAIYRDNPACDFLFCALKEFGNVNREVIEPYPDRVTDLGFTSLITFTRQLWIGAPTSAVSIRRALAEQFFPIPFEQDWRIQADECLIWLTSLYNGRKFYLNEPSISYRVHGNNRYYGHKITSNAKYYWGIRRAKLFAHAAEQIKQYHYIRGCHLLEVLLREAATGRKNSKLLGKYRLHPRINQDVPLLTKWKYRRRIARLIKQASKI